MTAMRSESSRISSRSSDTRRTAAPRLRCSMICARMSETEARIGDDEHVHVAGQLAREYGALHIAAREIANGRLRRRRLDIVAADQVSGGGPHRLTRQPEAETRH